MTDTNKKPKDIVEETIEETMQGIVDEIADSEEFVTVESGVDADEDFGEEDEEETETVEEGLDFDDTDSISDDDDNFETSRGWKVEDDSVFYLDEDDNEDDEDEDEDDDEDDEYGDEETEESEAVRAQKKHKRRKRAGIILGSVLGVLIIAYLGVAFFFSNHFFIFTKINGVDFSMKSVEQVEAYMEKHVSDYVLTLNEADGKKESINGGDISLKYVQDEQLSKFMKKQNNFLWIEALWNHPKIEAKTGVEHDEAKLKAQVEKLNMMAVETQVASVDAHPEFKDTEFVIVPEVVGTQINMEKFNEEVKTSINGLVEEIDLAKKGCYIKPRFVSDSQEVIAAKDAMNKYLGANVTYDFNPHTEVVDASVISQWVKVDADMNVVFDEGAVRAYVESLAGKYNTAGKTRSFVAGGGNTVTVEGGDYGWRIDQEAEYNALIANIQNAETVTREANYSRRAASHGDNDFGGTYAEVDLTNQQIYFFKDGQLALQSACVTGNPNKGYGTPAGTFALNYKALDQTLRGTKRPDGTYEYETPVKFWMPFNGGVGFHDATWQPTFGGQRYLTNGSHGCINLPYNVASQLYNLISSGVPVIVHY